MESHQRKRIALKCTCIPWMLFLRYCTSFLEPSLLSVYLLREIVLTIIFIFNCSIHLLITTFAGLLLLLLLMDKYNSLMTVSISEVLIYLSVSTLWLESTSNRTSFHISRLIQTTWCRTKCCIVVPKEYTYTWKQGSWWSAFVGGEAFFNSFPIAHCQCLLHSQLNGEDGPIFIR